MCILLQIERQWVDAAELPASEFERRYRWDVAHPSFGMSVSLLVSGGCILIVCVFPCSDDDTGIPRLSEHLIAAIRSDVKEVALLQSEFDAVTAARYCPLAQCVCVCEVSSHASERGQFG